VSVEDVCREHCRPYSPEASEVTSVLDYEQCIFNCKDVYELLAQLVELVKKYCEEEVNERLKERPELVREKVYKICLGYHLGVIAYNPELVEKLLKLIAGDMGIEL
jgi:regulatory protein YycH of two-component signal transduction system YycFG